MPDFGSALIYGTLLYLDGLNFVLQFVEAADEWSQIDACGPCNTTFTPFTTARTIAAR